MSRHYLSLRLAVVKYESRGRLAIIFFTGLPILEAEVKQTLSDSVKTPQAAEQQPQPIAHNEDVAYSERMADAADQEAQRRANAADQRQNIRP